MGIVPKATKKQDKLTDSNERKLERELKECMRCKFFHGNNSRCLTTNCIKVRQEKEIKDAPEVKNECTDCPYGRGKAVCFPCMKSILANK